MLNKPIWDTSDLHLASCQGLFWHLYMYPLGTFYPLLPGSWDQNLRVPFCVPLPLPGDTLVCRKNPLCTRNPNLLWFEKNTWPNATRKVQIKQLWETERQSEAHKPMESLRLDFMVEGVILWFSLNHRITDTNVKLSEWTNPESDLNHDSHLGVFLEL